MPGTKTSGFAALSPEQRRDIARRGAYAARDRGTAHRWRAGDEALAAGRQGGLASAAKRRAANAAAGRDDNGPRG